MSQGQPRYPLNTAAQMVGISPRTLRSYEDAGLIAPARVGGNRRRMYSEQDLHWLRCIRDMIHDEGLTVVAIRRLLDLIPCWEIRHCGPAVALRCAPYQNVPRMARDGRGASLAGEEPGRAGEDAVPQEGHVDIVLIYGVEELGAVMHCSRCLSAERAARRVALKFQGRVSVRKLPVDSPEARRHGLLMPPAIIVGDEVVSEGKGMSEERLEEAVQRRLEASQIGG